jgi:TrmH family RNA methyltransferase
VRSSPLRARRSKLPEQTPAPGPTLTGEALGPRHGEVRRLRELLRDPKARAVEGAFVVEGPHAVEGALDRGAPLEVVYFGPRAEVAFPGLAARVAGSGLPVRFLKDGVLEKVGSTRTPQPVLAVAPITRPGRDVLTRDGLVVVGTLISDPGNLGTILRSAEASGAAAIVLGPGSVDAYNPKVVRASAGAIFGMPVLEATSEGWSPVEALDALGALGRQRLGADASGATPYDTADLSRPTAVVLGNEAHGLAPEIVARLDGTVAIPMAGATESLNVAMAATVLCFESARQRRVARGGDAR